MSDGFIIIDNVLKKNINDKLDKLDNKLELIDNCTDLRDFLLIKDQIIFIIQYINKNINKNNFDKLILDNIISNNNLEIINEFKLKKLDKPPIKKFNKIKSNISFADVLKMNK